MILTKGQIRHHHWIMEKIKFWFVIIDEMVVDLK